MATKKGFAVIPLLLGLFLIITVGLVLYTTKLKPQENLQTENNFPSLSAEAKATEEPKEVAITPEDPARKAFYQNLKESQIQDTQCEGNVVFTFAPTTIDAITKITPGSETGDKRYTYLWIRAGQRIPLFAPTNGKLVKITYKTRTDLGPGMSEPDYDLAFQAGCQTLFVFNHVTEPIERIAVTKPISEPIRLEPGSGINDQDTRPKQAITVNAGEQIGTTNGTPVAHNFDLGVFVNNQAVCPYEKFSKDLSVSWLALFNGSKCVVSGEF